MSVEAFSQGEDGVLRYQGRLCFPNVDGFREQILEKAYSSRYSINSGATKMYVTYGKSIGGMGVKRTSRNLWPNVLIVNKLRLSTYSAATRLNMGNSGPDDQVLSFHSRQGEVTLLGSKLVHEVIEKIRVIRERLRTTQSWQKSYADVRRGDLELYIHDWIYLKISPMKGVMRFGKKGKLSPRFVGPYEILRLVEKKFIWDPSTIVPLEGLEIKENLAYEEVHVDILDRKVKSSLPEAAPNWLLNTSHFTAREPLDGSWEWPWAVLGGVKRERKWLRHCLKAHERDQGLWHAPQLVETPREGALGLWAKGTCCLALASSPRMGPRLVEPQEAHLK
ncbi:hypothetical protein MTR67_006922 [Solanum verrucosum]|uniref:Tf2-1-like SH3-like domain-containing protein n=1 Tax=Solanum verrucosum TaxID=315347 RepID=A0AAF0TA47_SOLVR|nr:hypothetical protein MTR67_006922 [Solanum verrucosum]